MASSRLRPPVPPGDPANALGRAARHRFGWQRRLVEGPRPAVGRLARSSAAFGDLVGRPLSTRRALTTARSTRAATEATALPVSTPSLPYLAAWWHQAKLETLPAPPAGGRRQPPAGRRDLRPAIPRRGLPAAVARTPVHGRPGTMSDRMTANPLPVRVQPEVAAVGRVATPKEMGQTGRSRRRLAAADPDAPRPAAAAGRATAAAAQVVGSGAPVPPTSRPSTAAAPPSPGSSARSARTAAALRRRIHAERTGSPRPAPARRDRPAAPARRFARPPAPPPGTAPRHPGSRGAGAPTATGRSGVPATGAAPTASSAAAPAPAAGPPAGLTAPAGEAQVVPAGSGSRVALPAAPRAPQLAEVAVGAGSSAARAAGHTRSAGLRRRAGRAARRPDPESSGDGVHADGPAAGAWRVLTGGRVLATGPELLAAASGHRFAGERLARASTPGLPSALADGPEPIGTTPRTDLPGSPTPLGPAPVLTSRRHQVDGPGDRPVPGHERGPRLMRALSTRHRPIRPAPPGGRPTPPLGSPQDPMAVAATVARSRATPALPAAGAVPAAAVPAAARRTPAPPAATPARDTLAAVQVPGAPAVQVPGAPAVQVPGAAARRSRTAPAPLPAGARRATVVARRFANGGGGPSPAATARRLAAHGQVAGHPATTVARSLAAAAAEPDLAAASLARSRTGAPPPHAAVARALAPASRQPSRRSGAGTGSRWAAPATATTTELGTTRAAAPPASSPQAAFADSLRRRPAEAPSPLPRHLQPLAAAVVGPAPIRVATGPASRAALGAAGKRAATVERTIHLDQPAEQVPVEILAHELVHAAHPDPGPRFFDDHRHDGEEDLARRVGRLARSLGGRTISPAGIPDLGRQPVGGPQLFAASGTSARAETRTLRQEVEAVHRRAATPPARSVAERFVARAGLSPALARAVTTPLAPAASPALRGAPGSGLDAVRRGPALPATPQRRAASVAGTEGPLGGAFPDIIRSRTGDPAVATHDHPQPATSTANLAEETIEWIIEQVEQRVLDELDRRGLRNRIEVL